MFCTIFFATLVYKYFGETLQGALSQEKLPHPGGHHSSIIWATKTLIDFLKVSNGKKYFHHSLKENICTKKSLKALSDPFISYFLGSFNFCKKQ